MPEVKEQTEVGKAAAAAVGKPEPGGLAELLPKLSMYGIVCLVAVFAAYLVTVKVIKPMTAQQPPKAAVAASAAAEEDVADNDVHGSGGHGEAEGSEGEPVFHTIESVVVNPAGTAGTRFLSCSVNFEVAGKEDLKAFAVLDVQIRDLLITILSSKTVTELADVADRSRMRREILTAVNKLAAPAQAKAVYLTDFVLQ